MNQVSCWECRESFSRDKVFDIEVFRNEYTVKWCFNCAMKQLIYSDYSILPTPKNYNYYKIESIEDDPKKYHQSLKELSIGIKLQWGSEDTILWNQIHAIAQSYYQDIKLEDEL